MHRTRIFNSPNGGAQHPVKVPRLGELAFCPTVNAVEVAEAIDCLLAVLFFISVE